MSIPQRPISLPTNPKTSSELACASRPKTCIHTPFDLKIGTKYECHCSKTELIGNRSNSLIYLTDGTAFMPHPDEPQIAIWCYCSDGPGHQPFQIPARKVTREEKMRRDEVQWRAERKALAKGRDCLALRRGAKWLMLMARTRKLEQGVEMKEVGKSGSVWSEIWPMEVRGSA